MELPLTLVGEAMLVLIGFVIGKIWNLGRAVDKRVTYEDCSRKREKCPCITDIEELKKKIEGK